MKTNRQKLFLLVLFSSLLDATPALYGQSFGPELINNGTFGTIATQGKNGDDPSKSQHIYYGAKANYNTPILNNPPIYQPNQVVNPGVIIGYPLWDASSYHWGMNEVWNTKVDGIPIAPDNGLYIVANSTMGMYNNGQGGDSWNLVYDKNETNLTNPRNYFLIVNAHESKEQLFLMQNVSVNNGQTYRISFDLADLDKNTVPEVAVVISTTKAGLATDPEIFSTGSTLSKDGKWKTYSFDYTLFDSSNEIYIGFRNNKGGGQGLDLALDNLSMKSITPHLQVNPNNCAQIEITADIVESFENVDKSVLFENYSNVWATNNGYTISGAAPNSVKIWKSYTHSYQWQKMDDNGVWQNISGATSINYVTSEPGVYRLTFYTTRTNSIISSTDVAPVSTIYATSTVSNSANPLASAPITLQESADNCFSVPNPTAVDDAKTVAKNSTTTIVGPGLLANDNANTSVSAPLSIISFKVGNTVISEGNEVIVYNASGAPCGSIIINSDGSYTFSAAENFVGEVPAIEYTVIQGAGTAIAYLNITVADKEAKDDKLTMLGGGIKKIVPANEGLLSNDSEGLTVSSFFVFGFPDLAITVGQDVTIPNVGTVKINADGSYEFTPLSTFVGKVPVINYVATDDVTGVECPASLLINVDAIEANDDTIIIPAGRKTEILADGLLSNDFVVNGPLTITKVTYTDNNGIHAVEVGVETTIGNNKITINSDGSYQIEDHNGQYNITELPKFTYTVTDTDGNEDLADFTVKITASLLAQDDFLKVSENTTTAVSTEDGLLKNDFASFSNGTLSITEFSIEGVTGNKTINTPYVIAGKGTITINADGSYVFEPVDGFVGEVPVITYTLQENINSNGWIHNEYKTAKLHITVEPSSATPSTPTATDDEVDFTTGTITVDLLGNDKLADGTTQATKDNVTVTLVDPNNSSNTSTSTSTANATIEVENEGTWTYNYTDGKLTFTPESGFTGVPTAISYTITEDTGISAVTSDPATITVIDLITFDASCSSCPVKLTVKDASSTNEYELYEGANKIGSDIESSDVVTFTATAGVHTYIVKNETMGNKSFTVTVHPASTTWKTSNSATTWTDATNWTGNEAGYPIWCTDVTIPSGATTYPEAIDGDACRDITFKPGASVEQVQRLLYRKAFVEYLPSRNAWHLTSAPLRYMYSADYHADKSWTNAISPKIFMMNFGVSSEVNPDGVSGKTVGDFTNPFAELSESLNAGNAFALWVNGKTSVGDYDNANFGNTKAYEFPRRNTDGTDVTYAYHYKNTGTWENDLPALGRGKVASITTDEQWITDHNNLSADQKDNRFRFAFETLKENKYLTVGADYGQYILVGNPYMSTLNVKMLISSNWGLLEGNYYTFDWEQGTLSSTFIDGLSVSSNPSSEITPMESFFVKLKSGVNSPKEINFFPNNTLVKEVSSAQAPRRLSVVNNMDIIRLYLKDENEKVLNQTLVAISENASNDYVSSEDALKMFAPSTATAEIYTMASNNVSLDIQQITTNNEDIYIPIGLRVYEAGDYTINTDAIENLTQAQAVSIFDATNSVEYYLNQAPIISFSATEGVIENRFYIHVLPVVDVATSVENNTNKSTINVYSNKEAFVVTSSAELSEVDMIDATGKIVYSNSNVNTTLLNIPFAQMGNIPGVYVLRVNYGSESRVIKVVKQ